MTTDRTQGIAIRQLGPDDLGMMDAVLTVFGNAFDEVDVHRGARPSKDYMKRLLANDTFIALAGLFEGQIVGGIAAYELPKFEQERKEIYLYDLAVAAEHRRKGVATALIGELRQIASVRGAHVIFVQADHGDEPAIALYTKLGTREDVLHFDIQPDGS